MASLFEQKHRAEIMMILADEKMKELKRKEILTNAGDNHGLKENLSI